MKEITLDEMKELQLEMLKEIHRQCEAKGITYFLAYGSLLGAVRHKGFIPWDDDIDLWMPRPDYEKFVDTFSHSRYKVVHKIVGTKKDEPFAKVCDDKTTMVEQANHSTSSGVFIDIFPIDGLGSDRKESEKHFNRVKRWRDIASVKRIQFSSNRSFTRNFKLGLLKTLFLFIPYNYAQHRVNRLMKRFDYDKSDYVADLNFGTTKRIVSRKLFCEKKLSDFEQEKYFIPANYDGVLSAIWKNYMELPPIEERVTHHASKAYWKEQ